MTYNIRKLTILRDKAKIALLKCEPRYRNQARDRLQRLEFALFMAKQERVQSTTAQAALGLRSPEHRGAA